jgi:hypothetical protein
MISRASIRLDRRAGLVLGAVALLGLGLRLGHWDLGWFPEWSLKPVAALGQPYGWGCLLAPLGLLALLGWGAWRLAQGPRRRHAVGALALLGLLHFGLDLTLDGGQGGQLWTFNTVGATVSGVSNGFFAAATRIDSLRGFLRDYQQVAARYKLKLATHPPGAVLVYWVPLRLYQRLEFLQPPTEALLQAIGHADLSTLYLTLNRIPNIASEQITATLLPAAFFCALWVAALGALTVVPTYLLGARLAGRRGGLLAAALLSLMPGSLFFYLSLDVVVMMLTAWALAGAAWSLDGGRRGAAAGLGAGLALGLTLTISLGALASVALVAAYVVLAADCEGRGLKAAAVVLGWVLLGLLALAAGAAALGLDLPATVQACLFSHENTGSGVTYRHWWPWVVWNIVDYVLLAGLPIVVAAAAAVRHPKAFAPAAAWLGVMVLLSLSGITKGETERLWIFFNPLLAQAAAAVAVEQAGWCATLASQPLLLLLLASALPPLVRPY